MKKTSLKEQIRTFSSKLAFFVAAKKYIQDSQPCLVLLLTKNSDAISSLIGRHLPFGLPPAKSYTETKTSSTSFFGEKRKITVIKAD